MAKYSIDKGLVLHEGCAVGHYDLATGEVKLPEDIAASAKAYVQSLIFEEMVAFMKHDERPAGKIPVFAEEKAVTPEISEPPPCEPQLGDLTPAFVEWFRKHHSKEEFEARYKGRIPEDQESMASSWSGDVPEEHFGKENTEEWK